MFIVIDFLYTGKTFACISLPGHVLEINLQTPRHDRILQKKKKNRERIFFTVKPIQRWHRPLTNPMISISTYIFKSRSWPLTAGDRLLSWKMVSLQTAHLLIARLFSPPSWCFLLTGSGKARYYRMVRDTGRDEHTEHDLVSRMDTYFGQFSA